MVIPASRVPYDIYNQPAFMDRYNRVLENTVPNIQKALSALGVMSGLVIALLMVAVYILPVDPFAILLSVVPLLYSYFISRKGEAHQFELDQKTTNANRKKSMPAGSFIFPAMQRNSK